MKECSVQPLFDRVFVKKDDANTTKSGFIMPQTVKGRALLGTVVAVGPGMRSTEDGKYITPCVKVGDRVFLREFTGYVIECDGEQLFVFQENEILGVVKNG